MKKNHRSKVKCDKYDKFTLYVCLFAAIYLWLRSF